MKRGNERCVRNLGLDITLFLLTVQLAKFLNTGGIRGLMKRQVGSTSSEGDDGGDNSVAMDTEGGVASHSKRCLGSSSDSHRFPFPLYAPGIPLFVHAPHLMMELHPPPCQQIDGESPFSHLETSSLDPDVLSQLICQRWFLLCYRSKPCPVIVYKWLFQITCLSCDLHVADRAHVSLQTLVEWASDKTQVYVPTPQTVLDILARMGADRALLEAASRGTPTGDNVMMSATSSNDVFQLPPPLLSNVSNLLRYVSRAISAHPSALSTSELHQLFCMLAYLSLDSTLNKDARCLSDTSACVSAIVSALPESDWNVSLPSLSSRLVGLSQHHHDRLQLTRLLVPNSARMKQLQIAACKESTWRTVFPDTPFKPLPDWTFMWTVVEKYYDTPASEYVYYSMYTAVCLLTQLLHLCSPHWPSGEKKRDFKSMLSKLASVKIRDSAESVERAPVKDILIAMSLEMASQRSKDTLQTDLFSHWRQ